VYQLRYTSRAEKYFKKIKDKELIGAYNKVLDAIEADPYLGQAKTGDLAGIYCWDVYHNKTNYEIAYHILEEDGNFVIIIQAGTRENFYQELKRYMKS
jgi:hypothetical protein